MAKSNVPVAKAKRIDREISRLTALYKDIERVKRLSTKGLIEEAAFMKATLTDLKDTINMAGVVDEMPQGEYSILREHPALKSYNTMVQRYMATIKQLTDLLPKEAPKDMDDGFNEFVMMK